MMSWGNPMDLSSEGRKVCEKGKMKGGRKDLYWGKKRAQMTV